MYLCLENIRLVGGEVIPDESASGRLEVYLHNGGWGTVCNDGIDTTEAIVACKQLGYFTAMEFDPNLTNNFGNSSLPILMDDVTCVGSETMITSCYSNPIFEHDCDHTKDVAIHCLNYSPDP